MASVNFLYRSLKDHSCLNLRLLYRFSDKDYVIASKTNLEVSKDYWKKNHALGAVRLGKWFKIFN